jgi:hypothetical protein
MLNLYQPVVAQGSGLQLKSVGVPAGSSWPTQFQSGQHWNLFLDWFISPILLENYLMLTSLCIRGLSPIVPS